jgi:hypothetical protein
MYLTQLLPSEANIQQIDKFHFVTKWYWEKHFCFKYVEVRPDNFTDGPLAEGQFLNQEPT